MSASISSLRPDGGVRVGKTVRVVRTTARPAKRTRKIAITYLCISYFTHQAHRIKTVTMGKLVYVLGKETKKYKKLSMGIYSSVTFPRCILGSPRAQNAAVAF